MHGRGGALFAGDANIDLLLTGMRSAPRLDREIFCTGFARRLGGSAAIAASVHARLGGATAFAGLVGDDEEGRLVARELGAAGVDLGLLLLTDACPTGVTVNLVHGSTRTQVTYPGTLALTEGSEAIIGALEGFGHLHLSSPYALDAMRPRVAGLLERAHGLGLSTSLDTQWDEAESWEGLDGWLPHLNWLFVNEAEALSITGAAGVEEAFAALSLRTACPIVKLGATGVLTRDGPHPAFKVAVVDSTGAGDSFAAGFLYATRRLGLPFDASIRFGMAAGAVCCGFEGGVGGRMDRAAVGALLASGADR